jgi:hypothetical protein
LILCFYVAYSSWRPYLGAALATMTPTQQYIRKGLRIILKCTTEKEYRHKKSALLKQLRRAHPQRFKVDRKSRSSLEHEAKQEGMTLDEKLEEFALFDYVSHHRAALLQAAPPPGKKAAAGLAALGMSVSDLNEIARMLDEQDPFT